MDPTIPPTDPSQGLTTPEAARRLTEDGPNELDEGTHNTPLRIIASQFTDFMIVVLLGAAIVSGLVGDLADTIAILVIVVLNAIIGAVQEYRAERAVAALRKLSAPMARARRDGAFVDIPARDLVADDVITIEAGDVVVADLRLLTVADLRIDEAPLTGESQPVHKQAEPIDDPDAPLSERVDMAWRGTLVTSGHGEGLVVATGMRTELGRIAALLGRREAVKAPLQIRLARLGRTLALAVLAICALVFVAGLARGEPVLLMFLTALSLAVAAIPEALPAVVSVSLALGARRMIRRHALIRRLPAVETLGSVTFICADKTGTLTRNEMRAEAFVTDGARRERLPGEGDGDADERWGLLARAVALNNDAAPDGPEQALRGDPTEVALYQAAEAAGYVKAVLEHESPRVAEVPFEATRRRMTTVHRDADGAIAFVKGAPESVLERCRDPQAARAALEEAERLAAEGYRVLAFAFRRLTSVPDDARAAELERELDLLGLVALLDPPREEARDAVEQCKSAGITPVMITGDHPATARAIARRLGIAGEHDEPLTGPELARLTPAELARGVRATRVYARVSPEQKIAIVRSLQESGEFVAMTGDGVNDAPALEQAEIGVAMGLKGTEVARESADMVLLDDNFATIVAAVREGRRVFDDIVKFVKYTLTSNSGEIWTLTLAPFLGLPLPLLPIQILWINLVTDGLPGLALAVEREERDVMRRPPRPPGASVFAAGMWQHVVGIGLLIGALSLGSQAWALGAGIEHWQSIVFTVLTLSQLVHALAIRSERDSILTNPPTRNPLLLGAVLLTVGLQACVLYVPALNRVFGTAPLSARELVPCLALPLVVLLAVELEKLLARRGLIHRGAQKRTD